MEHLVIQLRPYTDLVEPEYKRSGYGWKPEMNQDEAWLSGQGPWKAKATRIIDCDKAIVLNPDHEIVCVAEITGVQRSKIETGFSYMQKCKTTTSGLGK